MTKAQCVSITDLRRNTKECFADLPDIGVKYVFINNKPKAVLVDIDDFDAFYSPPRVTLYRMRDDDLTPEMKKKIEKAKKAKKSDFTNIPC